MLLPVGKCTEINKMTNPLILNVIEKICYDSEKFSAVCVCVILWNALKKNIIIILLLL